MRRRYRVNSKREAILALAARHGASDVRLCGSVARGDEGERSDIDFLVRLAPGRSLFDHAALPLDLQDLLGTPVDVLTEGGLRPRVRDAVLREAVPL